jgi:uncharacterized protein (TIGR02996 family)
MKKEAGFLNAILARPEDEANQLVYADWLEDQDDPRAEFLRLTLKLGKLPPDNPQVAETQARLTALEPPLNPVWVATVQMPAQLRHLRQTMETRFGPLADLYDRTLYECPCLHPPAKSRTVTTAERRLEFALPPLLKAVFLHLGNGGLLLCLLGLRGGQTGFEDIGFKNRDIVAGYEGCVAYGRGMDGGLPWPAGLVPVYDGLGCGMVDYVDCTTPRGPIWRGDSGELCERLPSLLAFFEESLGKWNSTQKPG